MMPEESTDACSPAIDETIIADALFVPEKFASGVIVRGV